MSEIKQSDINGKLCIAYKDVALRHENALMLDALLNKLSRYSINLNRAYPRATNCTEFPIKIATMDNRSIPATKLLLCFELDADFETTEKMIELLGQYVPESIKHDKSGHYNRYQQIL